MALTTEQTTAQNFKDFYDRIRPLLNAQHYHVDRSGQELKIGEFTVGGAIPYGQPQSTQLTLSTRTVDGITKKNDFTLSNNKIFISEGTTVKITTSLYIHPGTSTTPNIVVAIYDFTHSKCIDDVMAVLVNAQGYAIPGTWEGVFTAPTGGAEIGLLCTSSLGRVDVNPTESRMVVQEVNRIVDPVQYVSSGINLEETPVGNIISYMGNNVPPHYLACDGSEHAIGTYPELEAHFIAEFGSVNYFGGDGTYMFAVPDLRGEFLRGTGTNSHANQGSGENVGVHQDSTEHLNIAMASDRKTLYVGSATSTATRTSALKTDYQPANVGYRVNASGTAATTATGVSYYTARPTNTSVQYCIKYESTYHVIVPSHAYKASVGASIAASTNSEVAATLNNSDIVGDISLVSGNYLVAPVDGWYSIGCNWTCHGSFDQDYYFEINGTGLSASKQIGLSNTLYLNKGDKVRIIKYNGAANEGRINFCLLTSNVHENIIAGGEVYSEEEQVIGTWTDGKPLYQRVYIINTPTANTYYGVPFGASIDKCVSVNAEWFWGDGSTPVGTNEYAIDVWTTNNAYTHATYQPNYIYGKTTMAGNYIVAVAKYTKTTDQANTYTYKNSLLLTRPDLWTPNTEIDFGGGLYGYRIAGLPAASITAASDTWTTLADIGLGLSQAAKMMSCGGYVGVYSTSGGATVTPLAQPRGDSFRSGLYFSVAGNLRLNAKSPTGSQLSVRKANDSLDVWCTYKK